MRTKPEREGARGVSGRLVYSNPSSHDYTVHLDPSVAPLPTPLGSPYSGLFTGGYMGT